VRASNLTQGITIGYNSISASGSNANQGIGLLPAGTGGVGIGTSSAQTLLQVYNGGGTASLSAETGMLKVTNSSANELSIGTNPAAPYEAWLQVKRSTGGGSSYPLALQPVGGNVGIGTTAPKGILDLGAPGALTYVSMGIEGSYIGFNSYWGGSGWQYKANGMGSLLRQDTKGFQIWTAPSNGSGADAPEAPVAAMTIAPLGNVGIGTTAPATALDVQGQIRSLVYNASAGTAFDWNNSNTQYTTATCGAFTFSNMKDGGIYTLIVKSTTQGTCVFTQAGLTFRSQTSLTTASGSYTIFNILVAGTDAFVTIRRGF
jgi:hypothetical protein